MPKKTYRQDCALAYAADLLGERWTLLILRELLIRPCRYGELTAYLQGMGSNLLAARLQQLEQGGLIERQLTDAKRSPYRLTAVGRTVEPLILAMIRWGYQFAEPADDYTHLHHWDLLAMKAFYRAERCRQPLRVQFQSDQLEAWVVVDASGFEHGFGCLQQADIVLDMTIRELNTGLQHATLKSSNELQAFVDCFELPSRDVPAPA